MEASGKYNYTLHATTEYTTDNLPEHFFQFSSINRHFQMTRREVRNPLIRPLILSIYLLILLYTGEPQYRVIHTISGQLCSFPDVEHATFPTIGEIGYNVVGCSRQRPLNLGGKSLLGVGRSPLGGSLDCCFLSLISRTILLINPDFLSYRGTGSPI